MARTAEKELHLLEDRVSEMLRRYRGERTRVSDLETTVKDLRDQLDRQKRDLQQIVDRQRAEIERLEKKSAASEEDLDEHYLRSRDRVRARVSSLLSRLDTL